MFLNLLVNKASGDELRREDALKNVLLSDILIGKKTFFPSLLANCET